MKAPLRYRLGKHFFLILLLAILLLVQVYPLPRHTAQAAELIDSLTAPDVLLQFTSGRYALGFEPGGVYLATGDHVLRENFSGTQGVVPQADRPPSADGQAQPLGTVTYPELWQGISLTYDNPPGGILRSTYNIEAGADPAQIALRYNVPVQINESGNLVFEFENDQMTASAPVAWQEINNQYIPVDVAFKINPSLDNADLTINFSLGSYNSAYSLTIDPTLSWNTFLGPSGLAYTASGNAITVDASGNIYVAGISLATWGSPVNDYAGSGDAFVAKLDSNGSLVWNTFLGSDQYDTNRAIAVDASGNVYVTGYSDGTWGSSPNPVRAFTPGGVYEFEDAFAAKLDSSGNLVWNTFLGSAGSEYGNGIAVDGVGNVYVSGYGDATWGAPVDGSSGGFVAKLNSSGNLVWNTFLGSESFGITVDGSSNVFVTGYSYSTWGSPVDAHAGEYDAFAAKLDGSGNRVWNTFMGSGGDDKGRGIALDSSGNVFISGSSEGPTWGSPVDAFSGYYTAFAAKLDGSGNRVWNTFMGPGGDSAHGIAVDGTGDVYVTGYSYGTWGSPVNAHAGGQ
jgi:hypothetical protein